MNDLTQASMFFAAMKVNARYTALNFYQQRQKEPLSLEEIAQIVEGTDNEIGRELIAVMEAFVGDAEE